MILGACDAEKKQEWLDMIGCTAGGDVTQKLLPILQKAMAPRPTRPQAVAQDHDSGSDRKLCRT